MAADCTRKRPCHDEGGVAIVPGLLIYLSILGTVIGISWLVSAFWIDAWGCRQRGRAGYDLIVVPGCAVWPGGQPSPRFERRISFAIELWQQGLAPLLLFTGGLGRHPPAEGEAAAAMARRLGVPGDAIRIEARSTSTEENARNSARLLSGDRLLLVTDTYHLWRARRVFLRYFAAVDGYGVLSPWPGRLRGALREVAAIVYYKIERRL
jgi:uncharacterized SAM-binding protein YcdF (DUF218 family)